MNKFVYLALGYFPTFSLACGFCPTKKDTAIAWTILAISLLLFIWGVVKYSKTGKKHYFLAILPFIAFVILIIILFSVGIFNV